jgi:hypothetical protein
MPYGLQSRAAEFARLGDVKLVPGMPVEVFIETADRPVLSYLVKPLYDQITRAFGEKWPRRPFLPPALRRVFLFSGDRQGDGASWPPIMPS